METAPVGVYDSPATTRTRDGARGGTAARIGRALLIALIGLGVGYLLGRVQGSFAVRDVESQLAEQRTEQARALAAAQGSQLAAEHRSQQALQRVEAQSAALTTSLELHRAAHLLALSRTALDARNFGIAEGRLREAQSRLGALTPRVPAVAGVVAAMAETRIAVAEDLEQQRAAVGALAEQLDSVLASVDTPQRTTPQREATPAPPVAP